MTIFIPNVSNDDERTGEMEVTGLIKVLFPKSADALSAVDIQIIRSKQTFVRNMYEKRNLEKIDFEVMYENQLWKFKNSKDHSDRFFGRICDQSSRVIEISTQCNDEYKINKSPAWYKSQFMSDWFQGQH